MKSLQKGLLAVSALLISGGLFAQVGLGVTGKAQGAVNTNAVNQAAAKAAAATQQAAAKSASEAQMTVAEIHNDATESRKTKRPLSPGDKEKEEDSKKLMSELKKPNGIDLAIQRFGRFSSSGLWLRRSCRGKRRGGAEHS